MNQFTNDRTHTHPLTGYTPLIFSSPSAFLHFFFFFGFYWSQGTAKVPPVFTRVAIPDWALKQIEERQTKVQSEEGQKDRKSNYWH